MKGRLLCRVYIQSMLVFYFKGILHPKSAFEYQTQSLVALELAVTGMLFSPYSCSSQLEYNWL